MLTLSTLPIEVEFANYLPCMGRKVDVDQLVDAPQVAEMLGLSNPNGVSVYQRRYADFPAPAVSRGRCRLWLVGEISSWAADHPRNASI